MLQKEADVSLNRYSFSFYKEIVKLKCYSQGHTADVSAKVFCSKYNHMTFKWDVICN